MQKKKIALFGNVRVLALAALLCAVSAVMKFLSINLGDVIRFSFENFPVIFSGIAFGPIIGGAVGIVSDLLGCLLRGYSIIPLITVSSMCIGIVAGCVSMLFKKNNNIMIVLSVFSAHIIGNMIVKTFALSIVYSTPFSVLLWRVPIYIITALVESFIIIVLYKSRMIKNGIERVKKNELQRSIGVYTFCIVERQSPGARKNSTITWNDG